MRSHEQTRTHPPDIHEAVALSDEALTYSFGVMTGAGVTVCGVVVMLLLRLAGVGL